MSQERTISAQVFYNGKLAGLLTKSGSKYHFVYDGIYINDTKNRPISITLPFKERSFESETLFPVFVNMLSEGANKRMQCRILKIDENDYFSLLLATTANDNIGPVTIKPLHEHF